jgi:hypothetical protein
MSFEWNSEEKNSIIMTVALPVLNGKDTIWFALQSLKNQESVIFGWELLIMEENGEIEQIVKEFVGKLPNCMRIKYTVLDPIKDGRKEGENKGKVLLIDKWVQMMLDRSQSSLIYVMQSADDYSPPKRLIGHYSHIVLDASCIFSTQKKGLFINMKTMDNIIYDGNTWSQARTHLNMAYRMTYFEKVHNTTEQNRGIDSYIRLTIEKETGEQLEAKHIKYLDELFPEIWREGFFTDGCNNISKSRRSYYKKTVPPYVECDNKLNIWEKIPIDVKNYVLNIHKTFKH